MKRDTDIVRLSPTYPDDIDWEDPLRWVCGGDLAAQVHGAVSVTATRIETLCKRSIARDKAEPAVGSYALYRHCLTCEARTPKAKARLLKRIQTCQPCSKKDLFGSRSTAPARKGIDSTLRALLDEGLIEEAKSEGASEHFFSVAPAKPK